MKKSLLPALRKELEHSFGRKILSSRDCLQMVEDIYQKTGYSINANTLRRFFGLVKTAYSASPSTLTILSKYCGFNSIDEIESITSSTEKEDSINKEEVLHYMTGLFRHFPVENSDPDFYAAIVRQTVHFLERNPSLTDRFQREVAKTEAGQYHYFELGVNMDRLNSYYGDGLRYYHRAKDTDAARVFHHSLQVLRYWLTDNLPLLESNMAALHALPGHGHAPHIMGRMIAAKILYAQSRNESIDKILLEASRYHVAVLAKMGSLNYPHFELALCEALVLTGMYDEATEFMRKGKNGYIDSGVNGSGGPFKIWERIIHSKKNSNSKKIDLSHKSPEFIHDNIQINKKYNNLLISLYQSRKQVNLLEAMIRETGFTKFNRMGK